MIKILSANQIKELDAYTIKHEPVPSIELMERACRAFVHWFISRIDVSKQIGIVCGTGNNGGDGLGIARLLEEWNYAVKVWVVRGSVSESLDFKTNLSRLKGTRVEIFDIVSESDQGLFHDREVMIDAVFGSGLSRPAGGIYAQVINCMNKTDALRIAVDVPSGLMVDQPSAGAILNAHYTVTFQLPKLAFLLPASRNFVGDWSCVDIGLSKSFIRQTESSHAYIVRKDARRILKPRSRFDHKGNFGHALLVSGSYGKMGATVLASRAALRTGVGLLTTHVPKCGYTILQSSVPEAMVDVDVDEVGWTSNPSVENYSAIGIGPGIGQAPETVKALRHLLEEFGKPVVLDADALNILSSNRELWSSVPEGSILTPHPKEFERLVGSWQNDFERLEKQKALAEQLRSIILVKGAYTTIATPEGKWFFNSSGNPGMAKGGSGDVLTGMLTSLLAQKYSPKDAAILGVYWHGLAGDCAAHDFQEVSMTASDIIDSLSTAVARITQQKA
jgi:NAD(P)H-hydrate epimerase